MSLQQVLFGLTELVISVLVSFFLVFATYRLILAITKRIDEENQLRSKNSAVGIVLGSVLVGEVIIVKQAIYPVMAVLQIFVLGEERNFGAYLEVLGFGLGYVLLTGILAVLCILFCFWLFDKLTPGIDEFEEIKSGNVAIAVLMAAMVIGVSILISSGVSGLTRALVPFPEIGSIPLE